MPYAGTDRYQSVPRLSDDDSDKHIELHERQQKAPFLPNSQHAPSGFSRYRRDRKGCLRVLVYALAVLVVVAILLAAGGSARLRQSLAVDTDGLESLLGPKIEREEGFT